MYHFFGDFFSKTHFSDAKGLFGKSRPGVETRVTFLQKSNIKIELFCLGFACKYLIVS